jgi:hypothetical protein
MTVRVIIFVDTLTHQDSSISNDLHSLWRYKPIFFI